MRLLFLMCVMFTVINDVSAETSLFNSNSLKDSSVVKVISSDTIVLEDGTHITLIGVESYGMAPRVIRKIDAHGKYIEEPIEPSIPMEEQALYYVQNLLENKKVRLEYDIQSLDNKRRKIAYVFTSEGKLANAEVLKQGFVRLKISPPNIKYAKELRSAYQDARVNKRGFLSN